MISQTSPADGRIHPFQIGRKTYRGGESGLVTGADFKSVGPGRKQRVGRVRFPHASANSLFKGGATCENQASVRFLSSFNNFLNCLPFHIATSQRDAEAIIRSRSRRSCRECKGRVDR